MVKEYKIPGNFIVILLIVSFILPVFGFAQELPGGPPIKAPGTIEEAIEMVKRGGQRILEKVPEIMKKTWREEAMPIWKKMWNWFKDVWANYIRKPLRDFWYFNLKPGIQGLLQRVRGFIGKEVKEKMPIIEEEFEKEKEEMQEEIQEEIPKATKSLWERFKELLK